MQLAPLKKRMLVALFSLALLQVSRLEASSEEAVDNAEAPSAQIIDKYLEATQNHEDSLRGTSIQVNIDASVPKLKEHATLRALRKISKVGVIAYQVLGFQGDNSVKSQVIARYLAAEQQGQGDQDLAITPANYKFKSKGQKTTDNNQTVYVFQLTPRKKKVGLFKGEMWLDSHTFLPVVEKGNWVKSPSIFVKKLEFERDFAIQNGIAVPRHISSTMDVRLFGTVQLNIDYSNFEQNADSDDPKAESVALAGASSK